MDIVNSGLEHFQHALVILWVPSKLKPISLKELEAKLGPVEGSEIALTPSGPATIMRLARHHITVALAPDKLEFTATSEPASPKLAKGIARAVGTITEYAESPTWKAIGYNFNVMFNLPADKLAIRAISESTVDLTRLKTRIKYPLLGAASWLYFDVEGAKLWLRLEPRASDPTTSRVWAFGNFSIDLENKLPSEAIMASDFEKYYDVFISILGEL